jgi:hypothetical protein
MARIGNVLEFVRNRDDPWLIVGKGPSLDRFDGVALAGLAAAYNVLTLNHACRVIVPDLAHFCDLEALRDCALDLVPMQTSLCVPWWPHVAMRPGRVHLKGLADASGDHLLGVFAGLGRLWSYNSTVASKLPRNRKLPEIRVRYFSAVAAFNILARAGCKRIATVGVDGGTGYSVHFDAKDRLANGRDGFDVQFAEIEATCRQLGVEHIRLGGS